MTHGPQRSRVPDGAPALVTGASSGIGEAIARRLAGRASPLVVTGRDPGRLDAVAGATGAHGVVADLTTTAGRAAVVAACGAHGVGLVVHAAGVGAAGPFSGVDPDTVDAVLAADLVAPVQLTRALWPDVVRARGHVVFVASIAALGVAGEATYSAAKAGLRTFADALRLEEPDVGVTTVLPGVVDTPFLARRGYDRSVPRPVSADRVAAATLRAVERGRAEVFVPRWLQVASVVQGAAPAVFRWASPS
ncbi:SDR family oxidoreductase [Actinomycetospora sp. TBRC 11914]|uniref:SDR family NAD(P)-dependent oxidoreductase n=1 Tax=Actinomycetospora sp. TBRC 11914 TaxID=2729387 RepID=UPI00145D74E7|nr:SDR family NAD(P)-dependent oxidoreductase [Actinomycetospora sp. TBRC 11914]NMO88835.1 SDR family NAD(P)-dependent oxidoreductase [Actinomycetospora sp. TBRC 11914]